MKFKYIIGALVLAASLAIAGPAFTQGPGGPGRPPGGQMGQGRGGGGRARMQAMEDGIFKQLKLTSKQKSKIDGIRKWRMDSMRKMMPPRGPGGSGIPGGPVTQSRPPRGAGGPGGPGGPGGRRRMDPAMRAKMDGLRAQYDAKLKKALTASQYKKYHALMDAERTKMRQSRGGRPGGPPARAI